MQKLLEIKNLSISYDNKTLSLENINFDIKEGEIISIVGESGSGKTTLIRSILNLLPVGAKIEQGEIKFLGKEIGNLNKSEFKKIRGKEIGMIFQDTSSSMNPIRTIGSQFIEYIRIHQKLSKKEAEKLAISWLEKVKLEDTKRVLNSYPFELSGGMKQRVAIAMVMCQKPKLILADEPTSALDTVVQLEVVKELKKIRDEFNTSIIIITHNIGVAFYLSDKIGIINKGKLVEFGEKDEIIKNSKNSYTKMLLKSVENK